MSLAEAGPLLHPLLAEFGRAVAAEAPAPLPELAATLAQLAREANDGDGPHRRLRAARGAVAASAASGWVDGGE